MLCLFFGDNIPFFFFTPKTASTDSHRLWVTFMNFLEVFHISSGQGWTGPWRPTMIANMYFCVYVYCAYTCFILLIIDIELKF